MKDTAKKIGKSILLLPVGALLGTLLLLLAYCLPVNGARAEESLQIKVYEGEYPSANILHNNAGQNFGTYKPETLDDATDYEILRRVYYDLNQQERRAPETKAAKAIYRRELKEMRRQGCLSLKCLCRAAVFGISPELYRKTWNGK